MSKSNWLFTETSPSTPSTTVSSRPVQNAASYLPAGVCGPFGDFFALSVLLEIPANTTGGQLQVFAQISVDDGQTWYDKVAFPPSASLAAAVQYSATLSLASGVTTPIVVGKNAVPALTQSGTTGTVSGPFGDRMRLVFVAAAGTSSSITITARVIAQRKEQSRPR